MSYWISLHDDQGNIPSVETFTDGGTYAVGGSNEADLNVTYNYCRHFDFRGELHGKKAVDIISIMEQAVATLGTLRDPDYWAATPGNAGAAVAQLLVWAKQHPNCTWEVR